MKPVIPHDSFDDLIAAALHGELTPKERTQFEARLSTDPAARAAYQEAQAMHDLLEKTHRSAQPDPNFEQRMVSGVRRKLQTEKHTETAWESVLVLWAGLRSLFRPRSLYLYGGVCSLMLVLFLGFVIYSGNQVKGVFATITSQLAMAGASETAPPREEFMRTELPKQQFGASDYNGQAMKHASLASAKSVHDVNSLTLNGGMLKSDAQPGESPSGAPPTAMPTFSVPAQQAATDAQNNTVLSSTSPLDRNGFVDEQQKAVSPAFNTRSIAKSITVRDGLTSVTAGAISVPADTAAPSSPTTPAAPDDPATLNVALAPPPPSTPPAALSLGNTVPTSTSAAPPPSTSASSSATRSSISK